MSRILVVSEFVSGSQNSTGYFWEKAIRKLNTDGHEVRVVASKKHKLNGLKKNLFFRFIFKAVSAISLVFEAAVHLRKDFIIFSGTNPELLFVLLAFLKKIIGFKWYVLVHDVFPDNLVPAGVVSGKGFFFKFSMIFFGYLYKTPDKLFVIGRDMRCVLLGKGVDFCKIHYIPNWVDSNDIALFNKKDSEIIKSIGWQDKVVFQFFGNIGRVQGVACILDAIQYVKSPRAAFLFIGSGVNGYLVSNYIKDNSAKNCFFYGSIAQEMKSEGLAACDIAVISLSSGMYGLGVPSKAYFSLAANRPILAVMDADSEVALMIKEDGVGWVCSPDDPRNIARVIDEICDTEPPFCMGNPREIAEKKYSEENILSKLSEAFLS